MQLLQSKIMFHNLKSSVKASSILWENVLEVEVSADISDRKLPENWRPCKVRLKRQRLTGERAQKPLHNLGQDLCCSSEWLPAYTSLQKHLCFIQNYYDSPKPTDHYKTCKNLRTLSSKHRKQQMKSHVNKCNIIHWLRVV